MQRIPVVIFNNVALSMALAGATYTSAANTLTTISAATLNNTAAGVRTVTMHIVPSGGTAGAANQIASAVSVPAAGSAPTVCGWLVGQTIPQGGSLQALADTGAVVAIFVSGYQTTL